MRKWKKLILSTVVILFAGAVFLGIHIVKNGENYPEKDTNASYVWCGQGFTEKTVE